ncbi:glycerol-3-phosphate acyltransferase [Chloroflexota bacterium]
MITNEVITGIIAIVIGYLLGSIPSAYIATRLATGKDIRKIGGGNVGGLNVYREVGAKPALAAGIFDLCKGAAAVVIAHWLLHMPPLFVLLAGLGAVIGHNWMVWLKFSGGKGMGATFGALAIVLPLYGYWYGLLILIGLIIIPFIITRNVALSMGTGILLLPLITWLITKSGSATIIAAILVVLIVLKFLPTARAAWVRNKTKKGFIFDRGQRNNCKQ